MLQGGAAVAAPAAEAPATGAAPPRAPMDAPPASEPARTREGLRSRER
jgi:hypothetical protein